MDQRLARALVSLDGLSVGDAFGERTFGPRGAERVAARELAPAPWRHTDDTQMGMAVVEVLAAHGRIDTDALAARFAARYRRDPARGYGGGAHRLLAELGAGVPWWQAAPALFDGGSYGNGAAMRAGPIGAYFADDLAGVVAAARDSAAVTHAHDEGKAGAIAVALAAAAVARGEAVDLVTVALAHTPPGRTRDGLELARDLPLQTTPREAAAVLGSGAEVAAFDTVPFSLWCARRHVEPPSYLEALWATATGRGDVDTTCAIVGSIIALAEPPPADWLAAREPLDLVLS
ncbi:MAG: ADP-ribosylglycohydrolase family protein [Deltaproteobacteria bacterium]|nr:ADP-ribosylglycohydrolase family protein [Deltaproteobacteria bacterium]